MSRRSKVPSTDGTGGMPVGRGRHRGNRRSGRLRRQSKRMYPGMQYQWPLRLVLQGRCLRSRIRALHGKVLPGKRSAPRALRVVDRTWPDQVRCGCDRFRCAPTPACTVQSSPCREKAAWYARRITTLRRRERRRRSKGVARDVGLPVHRRAGRSTDRLRCTDVLAGPGAVQIPLVSGGRPRHRLALEGPTATVVPRGSALVVGDAAGHPAGRRRGRPAGDAGGLRGGGSTPNKRVERLMTELEATRTSALPA